MKKTGKIDVVNIVKKTSRDMFSGMDTRTRTSSPVKKKYSRTNKHRNRVDY